MILHPAALGLVVASALSVGMLLHASRWAVAILARWDLRSGARLQLELERRTVLVSAIVAWALAVQLGSLFLSVYAADAMAPLLAGAMCAAGALKATAWGYPALLLQLATAVLAALWLALHHVDAQAQDYPLVRVKSALLLALAPLALAQGVLQALHLAGLRPEVLTSCCGSLFARSGEGLAAGLASLPPAPATAAFAATAGGAAIAGVVVGATGRGAWALGALSAAALPASIAWIVAVLSPYVYELPAHRCPFCLLQSGYHHVGWAIWAALLGGALAGMAAGAVAPFGRIESLAGVVPRFQRRLGVAAALLLGALVAISVLEIATSHLRR